jgi:hypothetical protein
MKLRLASTLVLVFGTAALASASAYAANGNGQAGSSAGSGPSATLPLSGLDLGSAVFLGVTLILIGLACIRRARTRPERKSKAEIDS